MDSHNTLLCDGDRSGALSDLIEFKKATQPLQGVKEAFSLEVD